MMLLIYDKSNNRFKEIHTNPDITIDTVNSIMAQERQPKYRQVYAGEIIKEFADGKERDAGNNEDNEEGSCNNSEAEEEEENVSTHECSPLPKKRKSSPPKKQPSCQTKRQAKSIAQSQPKTATLKRQRVQAETQPDWKE